MTIAARALKAEVRTQYHTFMHIPSEVREALGKLCPNLKRLESEDKFRLMDSYTSLTGLPIQPEPLSSLTNRPALSLNDPSYLEKYTANIVTRLKDGVPGADKRWLHIDDNTSIYNRYSRKVTF